MENIPCNTLAIVGGAAALFIIVIYVIYVLIRRGVDLAGSQSPDQKPDWVRTTPPSETVAALQADDEAFGLYDQDKGEALASAFVEQIEDIVCSRLAQDPSWAGTRVDFGTASDGGLLILINGESYSNIKDIPDGRLREIIQEAVKSWEQQGQ